MSKKTDIQCSDCDDILRGQALRDAVPINDERVVCSTCRLRRERARKQSRTHLCRLDELYRRIHISAEKGS